MTLCRWYGVTAIGILMLVVAVILEGRNSRGTYKKFFFACFGIVLMIIGGVYSSAYRRNQFQKAVAAAKADIKARTVIQRGVVSLKDEWLPLKSPTGKKGAPRCLIELKETPYTFVLSERDGWNRHCADIQLRDIVTVKFVRPLDEKMLEVDALEFVDHTYEINRYNSSQPRN